MFARTVLISTLILLFTHTVFSLNIISKIVDAFSFDVPEDATLGFIQLSEKYGHKCERYDVITEDGYILGLFHIIGGGRHRRPPCLLYHGIFDSSDTWIIRGNESLAITLANRGHDVWVGNMRGNKHSRRHVTLDPDRDRQFWRFGLEELALKDLPAVIDFIFKKTGQSQINAIGHSEGTTLFYILGSTKPEYNFKVRLLISLAPIEYLEHVKGLFTLILKTGLVLNAALDAIHIDELLPNRTAIGPLLKLICSNGVVSTVLCEDGLIGPLMGYDNEEYHDFLSIAFGHVPAGTSRQNLNQFVQDYHRNRLAKYDYGTEENIKMYNSTEPPIYDFSNVTMKVALLVGKNDFLANVQDVQTLSRELPNIVEYKLIDREKMDHMDFVWGKHMYQYLFPTIFNLLDTYD